MSSTAQTYPRSRTARFLSALSSLLSLIKEAIFGTHKNFTTISINRAIVLLAVPMVLEMAMESLFGIVDMFFVAHLGPDATATVGLTESLLLMVMAVAIGLSMGTTAVVARRTGEGDKEGAAISAIQSIILGAACMAVFFALFLPLAPRLLAWMGATPSMLVTGSTYSRIMMSSSGIVLMLFLINAIFRGAGDAAVAMRVLLLANVINICLDPCLIMGLGPFPKLGVTGAAVSTSIGRSVGILFQIYLLWKGSGHLEVHRRHLRLNLAVMRNILRIAGNGVLQFSIATASWPAMLRLIQSFGTVATAGATVGVRIVMFSILPSWGLGAAGATMVGQNLGAKKPDRAEQAVWRAGFFNMIYLGTLSLIFQIFAPRLVAIFSNDPGVISYGSTFLRIISLCYILYAWGLVVVQAFNGAGDTLTPTFINLFCFWVVQIPLAYWLSRGMHLGPKGAYFAVLPTQLLLSSTAIFVFRKGWWKRKVV